MIAQREHHPVRNQLGCVHKATHIFHCSVRVHVCEQLEVPEY